MAIEERPAIREHPEVYSGHDTPGGRYLRSFYHVEFVHHDNTDIVDVRS